MIEPVTLNLRPIARALRISLRQVEAVAQLLEEGKSVPFIARYRKDQTGGLEEEQIRRIRHLLQQARLLAQRKETILRSLQVQGKWTPELDRHIRTATTNRRLEDLYLPYKPKKEGLATAARARGLEPLAEEILQAAPTCSNLEARAADFINPDKQIYTTADALLGAGHILAEMISEHADLRKKLREVFYRTGRICSRLLETVPLPPGWAPEKKMPREAASEPVSQAAPTKNQPNISAEPIPSGPSQAPAEGDTPGAQAADDLRSSASLEERSLLPEEPGSEKSLASSGSDKESSERHHAGEVARIGADSSSHSPPNSEEIQTTSIFSCRTVESSGGSEPGVAPESAGEGSPPAPKEHSSVLEESGFRQLSVQREQLCGSEEAAESSSEKHQGGLSEPAPSAPSSAGGNLPEEASEAKAAPVAGVPSTSLSPAELRRQQKELKKQRLLLRRLRAYRDFFDFQEALRKISPYRVLTLNRAERQKILRVWIESDREAMRQVLYQECIPPEHPHADFLRGCADDALERLLLPSLEREARRELTEQAEIHAVEVVAKSLRKMLLQRPVRGKRILAVDPGLRNGYVLAALDEFGNLLEHAKLYLVGRTQDRENARQKLLQLIRRYRIGLVAIGNGVGSRIFENFLAELLNNELKTEDVRYGMVSEVGAKVYAHGVVGQEEFPYYDLRVRSAISIGRRLLDPLSELVKIEPAHLATGTYQHDVKAKHLQPLLEEVVESCVNRVGVDVNTAHPWLLRYVSGLNMVLARRVEQYRRQHGQFRTRAELKQIPGFGEGTFELAAGFLKIQHGPEPLDRTAIHPDCYELARKMLQKVSAQPEDLWNPAIASGVQKQLGQLDAQALAEEFGAGVWVVRQVLGELRRAGRDVRDDSPAPSFKRVQLKLHDLKPEMQLEGTVVHITNFGAFVDIGIGENGLVHISQMAPHYVQDPREVVSVGDTVKVWILQVDPDRSRISLSMIPPDRRAQAAQAPGSEKGPSARPEKPVPARAGQTAATSAPETPPKAPPPQKASVRPGTPERKPKPSTRQFRSKTPPPPAPKLSEAVKQGKQPMRTFAELLQFFQLTRQQHSADAAQPAKEQSPPTPSTSSAAGSSASPGKPTSTEEASPGPTELAPATKHLPAASLPASPQTPAAPCPESTPSCSQEITSPAPSESSSASPPVSAPPPPPENNIS